MAKQTEQLNKELGKLQEELQNLKSYIDEIGKAQKAASIAVEISEKILIDFSKLSQATNKLVKQISEIDFPKRFEKIDATISAINLGIQNILGKLENIGYSLTKQISDLLKRIENAERNLKEEVMNGKDSILAILSNQQKEIKTVKILIIVIIVFCLSIGVGLIFK